MRRVLLTQFILLRGWQLWKEATLIAETEVAFKIKTWYGGKWLSKKYFNYHEIKCSQQ